MVDHTEKLIRTHEAMLATLNQTVRDLQERYVNDRVECAERYKQDREESRLWRGQMDVRLDKVDQALKDMNDFLQILKPAYNSGARLAWIIFIGSLATIFALIWKHVTK
jgi:hypothetical protein